MNITFLVGNGFDINLGLNTRYTDFYPYYLSKKHNDMISTAIGEDYSCWADLELELGHFLDGITPEEVPEFLDSKAALESDLADYLRLEQKRIDLTSPNIQGEFQKNITEFYKEFSTKDRNTFLDWRKRIQEKIRYQFVSFNYTDVLDRLVEPAKQNSEFGSHVALNTKYFDVVGDILHLHGTLSDGMILALDNTTQIGNPQLQTSSDLVNYIIKSNVNESLGEEKTENTKSLIDNSDYVGIYGMSLGDTDLMWWKYLTNWLSAQSSHRLILYAHEEETTNPSGQEKLRQKDKWKNLFLEKANVKPDVSEKIRSQIIVVLRSKIFNFSNIEMSLDVRELDRILATI